MDIFENRKLRQYLFLVVIIVMIFPSYKIYKKTKNKVRSILVMHFNKLEKIEQKITLLEQNTKTEDLLKSQKDILTQLENNILTEKKLESSLTKAIAVAPSKQLFIHEIYVLQKKIATLREDLIRGMLAEKAENLTKNLKTDEEKTIAIAKWVSSNIANNVPGDVFSFFIHRKGLCGSRVMIFLEMLEKINIPAKKFALYNYPDTKQNHVCAEVYFNKRWHYFDVSYAGYFKKDNNILSFEEIVNTAKKEDHFKYLVLFPETKDLLVDESGISGERANNKYRMSIAYKKEDLIVAKSCGAYGNIINMYSVFDANKVHDDKTYTIGKGDKDHNALAKEAFNQGLSQCLGTIGTLQDNFNYHWTFNNLKANVRYTLKFYTYIKQLKGIKLWVNAEHADIIKGKNYENQDVWEICFVPHAETAKIIIGFDESHINNRQGIFLDKIEISSNTQNTIAQNPNASEF